MAKITISRDNLRDYGLPNCGRDEVAVIDDVIVGHSRWSVEHDLIFRWTDGKVYQTSYSIGATESQDEEPWGYDDEVECEEVRKVSLIREVWTTDAETPAIDYELLVRAAREFVAKVEHGEARSTHSYAQFKSALGGGLVGKEN